MKKAEFIALGITEELAAKAEKASLEELKGYVEKSKHDEVVEENKTLKTSVSDRDKQLETLKTAAGDNETLTKQIADLQAENTKVKETHESEMNQLKVDFAVEKALTGAKAKNIKAVKALLDLTDAKLDKEGNVKGLQEQIDKLTAADDTKFLFDATQQTQQQTFKGFQPGASAQQKPGAEVDPSKMKYDELCAYLAENPDAKLGE